MTRDDMTRYLHKPDGRQLARDPFAGSSLRADGKPFGCLFAFESETLLGIDTSGVTQSSIFGKVSTTRLLVL